MLLYYAWMFREIGFSMFVKHHIVHGANVVIGDHCSLVCGDRGLAQLIPAHVSDDSCPCRLLSRQVLAWAELLIGYALWLLMVYLTDVWKLTFTHAAGIVNVYTGLTAISCLPAQYISDALIGNYWMVVLSSLVLCSGMGLLTMSTPPVLAASTGTCSLYRPECIGDTQHILFYVALALIAIGLAGHATSLVNFLADQLWDALDNINLRSMILAYLGNVVAFLVTFAAILGFPYIKPWSLRFGIPTIILLVAILIFLSGSCSFTCNKPQGSHLTMVFRVLVASVSKLFTERPENINQLYEMENCQNRSRGFRFLDRAAIILPNRTLEEQKQNRWTLCTGSEVEASKIIISSIPFAISFIFIGLISSLGNTYFLEQARHMDHKVGTLTLPLTIFAWLIWFGRTYISKLYFIITSCFLGPNAQIHAPSIGIGSSMILGTICCIIAAKVESRRLDAVNSHGLLDKPDAQVPLTMFWLLPQFVLIGAVEGIYENSMATFFGLFCSPSLTRYQILFGSTINGLGCIGSILSVHITGMISEKGGKPSWFQDTLNKSRLDNYYWFLSCVCAVNLGLFLIMRCCYIWIAKMEYRGPSEENECCGCC